MTDLSRISVVLPSLDPDEKLHAVIEGLLEYGFTDIILVNDGSKPENLHYFDAEAAAHPDIIHLLHHEVNKGKGAALKNAFRWFLENRPDGFGVVTVDGDNQHHPEDTRRCCEKMLETGHMALGCRDFSLDHVPARSRFGNQTTSTIFKIFVGMTLSDTQTGLRAIPREDLELISTIQGDRFEYETNMLLAMKSNGIAFDEVKIRTVYIEENKSSHFHPIRDSWRIYKLILAHFFRYTAVSLASALLDTSVYALLTWLFATFAGPTAWAIFDIRLTAISAVGARVVSSLFNFFMNKKVVFKTNVRTSDAILRYYALVIPQMAAQVLLTQGVYVLLGIPDTAIGLRTLLYAVVMTALYIISFMIQQRWVFAADKKEKEKV
ncbi:MAG: bifunctional glycosyltransferase family 2/GtrA family protein [Oscillospiraceae bacterium]|nr:bifunctional glycosyltransferase family 2/GtrA family protein [Oscillospiraceae bacterium]